MRNQTVALLIGASAFAASGAEAAFLTGDQITWTLSNPNVGPNSGNVTVGAGVDLVLSATSWNFDAGAAADEFLLTVSGSFGGFYSVAGGTTTIALTGLDFSGGEILAGFNVISSVFPLTVVTTPTSLSLSFTDGAFNGPVTFISGQFVTELQNGAPEPGTLALLGAGLAGLAASRRRRQQSVNT